MRDIRFRAWDKKKNDWFDDVFPELKDDTRPFVRVWLGDEPIEVED